MFRRARLAVAAACSPTPDFSFGAGGNGDTFHNQWQSYRTRADRVLELTAQHDYDESGTHSVLVKAIDIFGNDTTARVEVTVR